MRIPHHALEQLTRSIFLACKAPPADAAEVARLLVAANLMGLDSHGVLRVPQYVRDIREGKIVPGAPITVLRDTPVTAVLDGHWNFGQVGALRAVQIAVEKARTHHLGCLTLRRCRHVGCAGLYTRAAAEQGFIALALCGAGSDGHWVCPWGGREGRLATNPITFAAPAADEPIVMDFSTSAAAEGKVRLLLHRGEPLPPHWLVDAQGRPSTDPRDLYASPRGAILPFGGDQGYKGFGLSLMVQILSGILGHPGPPWDDPETHANQMWLLVVDIAAFMLPDQFRREMADLIRYIKSSALAEGHSEILMPGEPETRRMAERTAHGIPVDDETWRQIEATARQLGVPSSVPFCKEDAP